VSRRRFCLVLVSLAFVGCSNATPTIQPGASLKIPQPGAGDVLTAGGGNTCVLTTSGGVACWGANSTMPGLVSRVTSGVAAIAIGAGSMHTCLLDAHGHVMCWGNNQYGQLGNGSTADSYLPVEVMGLSARIGFLAVGPDNSCVLDADGGVKCWGGNCCGELGDGTVTASSLPRDVIGLSSGMIEATIGSVHTCALTSGGAVKCWGSDDVYQLGGDRGSSATPVDVSGLETGVVAIAAGAQYTCALTNAGAVECWGSNFSGQLGDGRSGYDGDSYTPVAVSGLGNGVIAIAAGGQHACALLGNGAVMCWGSNNFGQLGDGSTTDRVRPVTVLNLTGQVIAIAAGNHHSCALLEPGTVECWGSNSGGQLGDGSTTDSNVPVQVRFGADLAPSTRVEPAPSPSASR
jgi:alpha-tubulin suppressor-like RCC1 family protein